MKFATVSKSLVLGFALLLASSAFAGTKASLELGSRVTVNGTQLNPGEYSLQWEGSGPNVELSIKQGKKVLTKVQAHVVDLDKPAPYNAAVTLTNDKGPNSLTGVRFQGKKFSLEFGEASESMQAGSSK